MVGTRSRSARAASRSSSARFSTSATAAGSTQPRSTAVVGACAFQHRRVTSSPAADGCRRPHLLLSRPLPITEWFHSDARDRRVDRYDDGFVDDRRTFISRTGRCNDARAPQNDPSLPGPSFARLSFVAVRSYWLLDLTGQIRRASLALHRAEIGRHHRRLAPSGSRPFLPFAALSFHLPAFLEGEYSFQCLDRRASTDGLAYCGEVSFHSPRSGSSTTLIVCAVATS